MNFRKSRVLFLIALLVTCIRAINVDPDRRTLTPQVREGDTGLIAKPMPPVGPVGGELAGIAGHNDLHGAVDNDEYDEEYGAVEGKDVTIDISWMEDHLEDSHDYKKGYGIVERHFDALNALNSHSSPLEARELSSRLILGCLRNNPPVKRLIWDKHPLYVSQIFDIYLKDLLSQPDDKLKFPLLKRYLSILIELITYTNDFKFVKDYRSTLDAVYNIDTVTSDILIKVLELISLRTSNLKEAPAWVDRIVAVLNGTDIPLDELHKRFFFNALYKLKVEDKNFVIPKDFLQWLAKESEQRTFNLKDVKENEDKLAVRDTEQEEFDQKLVDSRHKVFGNPLAARIKSNDFIDEF